MKIKTYSVIILLTLCAAALLFAAPFGQTPSAKADSFSQSISSLSDMTEDECIDFIVQNGVEIPRDFVNEPWLEDWIKNTIKRVENDPNCMFVYSNTAMLDFAEDIRALVNGYNGVASNSLSSLTGLTTSSYTLQDSTFYYWHPNSIFFNCYAYAIGKTSGVVNPGYFSGGIYDYSLSLSNMALLVKNDLFAEFGSCVRLMTTVQPISILSGESMICFRTGPEDYHFMRYFQGNPGAWYHKPGTTAILKYNYTPSNSLAWFNEYADQNGQAFLPEIPDFRIYDSDIYYIVYSDTHSWQNNNNSGSVHTCSTCGKTQAHTYGAWTLNSGNTAQHKRTCTVSNCSYIQYESHTWGYTSVSGLQHTKACTKCSHSNGNEVHSWSGVYYYRNLSYHAKRCMLCYEYGILEAHTNPYLNCCEPGEALFIKPKDKELDEWVRDQEQTE